MSSKCCNCLTRYREIEKVAACKMVKDSSPFYDPPLTFGMSGRLSSSVVRMNLRQMGTYRCKKLSFRTK